MEDGSERNTSEQSHEEEYISWWDSLYPNQRASVVVFAVVSVLVCGASFFYLRSHILEPFLVPRSSLRQTQDYFLQRSLQDQVEEQQKGKDTDADGLSDYDELQVYHTSPYLPDTDSDGLSDATEVLDGTDPNCPKGQNCSTLPLDPNSQTSTTVSARDVLAGTPGEEAVKRGETASGDPTGVQAFLRNPPQPSSLSPVQARELLSRSRLASKSDLDSLGDDEVMVLYGRVYDQARGGAAREGASDSLVSSSTPPSATTDQ